MSAATAITRANQLVLAGIDRVLRPYGLTFSRYEALVLLTFTRTGSLPLGKMGERLMVHPTSITNTIDRLERQGYVRRVPHPSDRRAVLAEITDEGRAWSKKQPTRSCRQNSRYPISATISSSDLRIRCGEREPGEQ